MTLLGDDPPGDDPPGDDPPGDDPPGDDPPGDDPPGGVRVSLLGCPSSSQRAGSALPGGDARGVTPAFVPDFRVAAGVTDYCHRRGCVEYQRYTRRIA
jgi:hypothetical protein